MRHDIDHTFNRVGSFGYAERATVGNPSRRLVGVGTVDLDMSGLQVVRPGANTEEPGRKFGWVGGSVRVAVIRDRFDSQSRQGAVFFSGQFGRDVVVAGEGIRLEILHPVFDPLDGLAGKHRGSDGDDIARVDRHLSAETAANIGGDNPDLLFRQAHVARDQSYDGTDGVRGLRRHPHRQFPRHFVELGYAARCFNGRDVDPWYVDMLQDYSLRISEVFFSCRFVIEF